MLNGDSRCVQAEREIILHNLVLPTYQGGNNLCADAKRENRENLLPNLGLQIPKTNLCAAADRGIILHGQDQPTTRADKLRTEGDQEMNHQVNYLPN